MVNYYTKIIKNNQLISKKLLMFIICTFNFKKLYYDKI